MDQTADAIKRLVRAHADIFGAQIAYSALKDVKGVEFSVKGHVTITGEPSVVLTEIIRSYSPISGTLSHQIIHSVGN